MARSKDFERALKYASRLHVKQTRKGSDAPYISHLLAVAAIVLELGGTEKEAIAALLHDAVEDQGGRKTLEEIRRRYGKRVARIVAACSDTDQLPKPPWRERKEAYVERLELPCGLEQQQRSVAPAFLGERDLGLEPIQAGSRELVERPRLRGRQQPTSHIERSRPQAGLGGCEGSVGSPGGIARQRYRTP